MRKSVSQYRYNVGDIVQKSRLHYEILQRTRIRRKQNDYIKGYKTRCLKCGYIQINSQNQIHNNHGCGVCSGKIIVRGINSIQDTDSWMVDWFKNEQDAYNHASHSSKKAIFKCPDCGFQKLATISHIKRDHGFNCPKCHGGSYYPQRFMIQLLSSLNIEYINQYSHKDASWITGKQRYDFFIPFINSISQVHGKQHYQGIMYNMSASEISEKDEQKRDLALKNGINSYYQLDFSNCSLDTLKYNITSSGFLDKLGCDAQSIEWKQVQRRATKPIVKQLCEYVSNNKLPIRQYMDKFKIGRDAYYNYINTGIKLGWLKKERAIYPRKTIQKGFPAKYRAYDNEGNTVCVSATQNEMALKLSKLCNTVVTEQQIYRVVTGKAKSASGYKIMKIDL